MTKKSSARFFLILAVAFGVAALPALGEDGKNSNTSGSVTVGAQGGSGIDDSSKLQQYEIVHQGVFVPEASFSWNGGTNLFLDVKSRNLGLDDQFASIAFGKKHGATLSLTWDQNPNWMSNTAQTPYSQTISGNTAYYHVPDGMRQALQNVYVPWNPPTSGNPVGMPPSPCTPSGTTLCPPANANSTGFFAVEPWVANSQPIDLRYVRKTGNAMLTIPVGQKLNVNLSYSREQRDGNKNTTFYGGPNYEVATPIAYRTHNLRADAEFADGRFFANASLNYSKFQNDVLYAEIDNPERLELANPTNNRNVINDAGSFRLWLPPDNNAYTVDFSGGVTLPARHKVTASLSTGRMSMDTDLLPLSTNPNLATSATKPDPNFTVNPPYDSVSAKYNTFMGTAKLTGDPITRFGYSLTYRKYQLTDKTEEYGFTSAVRGDVGPSYSATGFTREHEGYDTQTIRGEVHVLPVSGLRLGLSYGQDKRSYDIREYADITDDVFGASLDYNFKWVSLHGTFSNLKRKPGSQNEEAIQPTWQGATQTDITERTRTSYSGLVTLTPTGSFAVTLSAMKQNNDFPESVTGLLDQSFNQFGVDLTYARGERFSAYGGYAYETYDFKMAAAYIPRGTNPPYLAENYWENTTKDRVHTFRVGLEWAVIVSKLDFNADFDYTKPSNDSQYMFVPGGAGEANGVWPATPVPGFPTAAQSVPTTFTAFPLVSKNFMIAKVRLSYHVEKNLTASVMWWKQKLDMVDWQYDQMQPYMGRIDPGANRWFFLGARMPSYDANIFRAAITYTF